MERFHFASYNQVVLRFDGGEVDLEILDEGKPLFLHVTGRPILGDKVILDGQPRVLNGNCRVFLLLTFCFHVNKTLTYLLNQQT